MTERWIALSVAIGQWVWLWPIGAVIGAAILRLIEHAMLEDDPKTQLTGMGKFLIELLSAISQVLIVAAGLGIAMLWSH